MWYCQQAGVSQSQPACALTALVAFGVLQDGDFHIARISVKQEVAKQMTDNDLLLLTKDHPQDENCR